MPSVCPKFPGQTSLWQALEIIRVVNKISDIRIFFKLIIFYKNSYNNILYQRILIFNY